MKNAKLKTVLPVYALLLAAISGGCGTLPDLAKAGSPVTTYAAAGVYAPAEPSFAGNWYEPTAERGYCTVTVEDGVCRFLVSWHDPSGSTYIWRFSGSPDSENVINYTDCVKELHSWNDKDEESVELIEENGCGSIWLAEENRMLWLERLNDPAPGEFVRE